MTTNDYLSIASLAIALGASLYTYLTNTKKYELSTDYRTEVLKWYADTVTVLIRLKVEAKKEFTDVALKKELLSRLSSNIEVGRFYFPNVIKGDGFGDEKSKAYRGYRSIVLEFLVTSYRIFDGDIASTHLEHVEELQKNFTSSIFEILDPAKYLSETKKHTSKTFNNDFTLEDYIANDAKSLRKFM